MTSCIDIIETDNPVKSPVNTIEEPKIKTIWNFQEYYQKQSEVYNWQDTDYIRNKVEVDSVNGNYFINIDLEVENADPLYNFSDRADRISSFRMKLDSIFFNQQFKPAPMQRTDEIVEFKFDSLDTQKEWTVNYLNLNNGIGLNIIHKKTEKIIEINFAFVFYPFRYETLAFESFVKIEYP